MYNLESLHIHCCALFIKIFFTIYQKNIIKIFWGSSTFTLDIISSALIGNIYLALSSALIGNIYLTLSSAIIGNIYLTISSALIGNLGWDNETSLSLKYRKIVLISFSLAINREHLSALHFTLLQYIFITSSWLIRMIRF